MLELKTSERSVITTSPKSPKGRPGNPRGGWGKELADTSD